MTRFNDPSSITYQYNQQQEQEEQEENKAQVLQITPEQYKELQKAGLLPGDGGEVVQVDPRQQAKLIKRVLSIVCCYVDQPIPSNLFSITSSVIDIFISLFLVEYGEYRITPHERGDRI